jgi:eukaryotic translation initiation factor 2C
MNTLSAGFGSLAINAPSWRPNLPLNSFAQNTAASDRGTFGRGSGTNQRGGNRGNYAGRTSITPLATFTGELTYPTYKKLDSNDTTPRGEGRQWKLPDTLKGTEEALSVMESPAHPTRQNFVNLNPESRVLTNHFEYSVAAGILYEYKIDNIGSKDKRRTKLVYQKAIESWDFLKSHRSAFATNNYDSIVAWEDLHRHILEEPISGDKESTGLWNMSLQDGNSTLDLHFELVRKIDTRALQEYSHANPQYEKQNFDIISRCLNLVISKTFDDSKLYRHAANKFFVKSARSQLFSSEKRASKSLEIVRGYYYTVKPGTGCLILNFNLATSAFYKPILVSTFLDDGDTFDGHQEDNLKGLRVYVVTERRRIPSEEADYDRLNSKSSRTKQVNFIGSPIEDLTFQKRAKNADGTFAKDADGSYKKAEDYITVVNYLRNSKYAGFRLNRD